MRLILSLIFIVLIYGCSTTETIIKPKEVIIEVPSVTVKTDSVKEILSDSFDLNDLGIPDSSMYEATFEIPNSLDKAVVKVYPKSKKAILTLPKQEVRKTIQDTTKITIKKTTTTPEKFGYAMYGIIGAIIVITMGWLAWNKYGKLLK